MRTIEEIRGAVARGWCAPATANTPMDADLAEAIAQEVWKADRSPNLGCATTAELLGELVARAEVGGYGTYKTVDDEEAR